jgi:hypothetical protein
MINDMENIFVPLALKLHAYGLSQLHDPNWTGGDLFDRVKQHVRGRVEPVNMLYKTLENGLLFHLGLWIQEEYFENDNHLYELENEYKAWYLADVVEAVVKYDQKYDNSKSVQNARTLIAEIDDLYNALDDQKYFEFLDSEEGVEQIVSAYDYLCKEVSPIMPAFYKSYALNYAERVFHDRQLCGFISELLVSIGFDGMDSPHDTEPKQWINRIAWPQWAVKAVRARDRGHCANCGVDMSLELEDEENIDHIVPLSKGGTNDLVNLQLLCKTCNLKKYNNAQVIKSSVPPYLKHLKDRKV